jgi:uncharacterized protein YrrD
MLYNLKSLVDCKIQAIDGELGKMDEFYFDDRTWVIRYMIVDTSNWSTGKKVLLSPSVIQQPDMANKQILVQLTKNQIQDSPDIDTKKPVSRQHGGDFLDADYWPAYGMATLPPPMIPVNENRPEEETGYTDPHLRSTDDVIGYNISALDGEMGHIDDIIIDDDSWTIQYWIVKTKNWLPGKKVLISPQSINDISGEDEKVYVDMTTDSIKNSPEYDPSKPIYQEQHEEEWHGNYHDTSSSKDV